MALITRFLKDLNHFCAVAVMRYLMDPSEDCPSEDASILEIEVDVYEYRLVIPRTSWAQEFYTLKGPKARLLMPASRDAVARLKDALITSASRHQASTFDAFWHDMMDISIEDPITPFNYHLDTASDLSSMETDDSPVPEDAGRILVALEETKLEWGYRMDNGQTLRRCIIDGGDMSVVMEGSNIEVLSPSVRCILGESQFALLMDILKHNYEEHSSFDQPDAPLVPPGYPLPMASAPPTSLGILDSEIPILNVHVRFMQCAFLFETPVALTSNWTSLGIGNKEAEMFLSGVEVTYTNFNTGSSRVQLISKGLIVNDIRLTQDDGDCIPVVLIRPSEGDDDALVQIAQRSKSRWHQMWQQLVHNGEPSAPSSDHGQSSTETSGFIVDWVLQQREANVVAGPMVMEVTLLDADIAWPYFQDFNLIQQLGDIFGTYYARPTCSPHPENTGADEWTYINCIMKRSKTKIPLSAATVIQNHVPFSFFANNTGFDGFQFCWDSVRVGYYWGGDGNSQMRCDFSDLSADLHCIFSQQGKTCLLPADGEISVRSHVPKRPSQRTNTVISCNLTELCLVGYWKQVDVIRQCLSKFRSLMHNGEAIEAQGGPFRSSLMQCHASGQSVKIQLEDDRQTWHTKTICRGTVADWHLHYRSEQRLEGTPVQSSADFGGALQVDYMNAALDAMDPFIEHWPFSFEFLDNGVRQSLTVRSSDRMNILATPAVIDPLAEVNVFAQKCVSLNSLARRSSRRTAGAESRDRPKSKYRLSNKSGVPLSYWTNPVEGSMSDRYSVMDGEEVYLEVNPVSKAVVLPHANTRVLTETISMLFAGSWNVIEDVVVDKVGKYVYVLKSPVDPIQVHVIVDVTVDGHTKMDKKLKLIGTFITQNETDEGDPVGKVVKGVVPSAGYLDPQDAAYLPLSSCSTAMLYIKVTGFKQAEKDIIRLEGSGKKLMSQQGLYTCPPNKGGLCPFHCCLEVQEASVKMQDQAGGNQREVQEVSLIFHPALIVRNLLPTPLDAELWSTLVDGCTTHSHDLMVNEGESLAVYDFDFNKTVKLKSKIVGFETNAAVDLKPNRKLGHRPAADRKMKLASTKGGFMDGDHFLHLKHLELHLNESSIGSSGARRVTVYCPYWILNRTDRQLLIKDRKTNFLPHVTIRQQRDEDDWAPVLFSTSRSTALLAVSSNSWSKAINLKSVGLKDAVHVFAPGDDNDDDAEVIFPHGVIQARETMFKSFTQMLSPIHSTESVTVKDFSPVSDDEDELPPEIKRKGPRRQRLDFSVSVHMGPGDFDVVKVLRISPRYILYNSSNQKLQIGQKGTKKSMMMDPETQMDYYWYDSEAPQQICVRPAYGTWCYSGGFRLDEVNDFGLRIRNSRRKGLYRILQVDVSLKGDSMICAFCNDEAYPPYRIENK